MGGREFFIYSGCLAIKIKWWHVQGQTKRRDGQDLQGSFSSIKVSCCYIWNNSVRATHIHRHGWRVSGGRRSYWRLLQLQKPRGDAEKFYKNQRPPSRWRETPRHQHPPRLPLLSPTAAHTKTRRVNSS